MIKYKLQCEKNHEFTSWFANSSEFERLKKKKMLECIYCNSKDIKKSIMSPRVINKNKENKDYQKEIKKMKKDLTELRKFVENNFEYVGDKFARKVREVYYDENKKKNIYGISTEKERKDLMEEGIDLVSIPWIDREN
jgi:Uncharacterized protein conserved in bacteria|tara:strand:- start:78 stop:491 length:414 start_codon:yes stop_codon:yes gene_type:complete